MWWTDLYFGSDADIERRKKFESRPMLTLNKLPAFVHAVIAEHIGKTRDILQITRDVARG